MSQDVANLRAAAQRGQAAERELAFIKAGIDTDSGPGRRLLESYDGSLAAADIQRAAARSGVDSVPGTVPAYDDLERSQTRERANLASGSEVPEVTNPDPIAVGYAEFHRARAAGASFDDAASHVVGRILDAAANGDTRVLHDQARYLADARGSARARR